MVSKVFLILKFYFVVSWFMINLGFDCFIIACFYFHPMHLMINFGVGWRLLGLVAGKRDFLNFCMFQVDLNHVKQVVIIIITIVKNLSTSLKEDSAESYLTISGAVLVHLISL